MKQDNTHTLVSDEDLKEHALRFLKSQDLMVLGTSNNDKVWSATVEYVATDEFELIFYSRPDSRHSQNIEDNSNVSAVISEMSAKKSGDVSIQIAGEARRADGAEWNVYYPLYEKKFKSAGNQPDHIIYVIKPNELWILDENLLSRRDRVQVI